KRRIARGIMKFVIHNPKPFVVRFTQSGFGKDGMQYPIDQPLTTIMTKAEHGLVVPFLAQYHTETNVKEVRGQALDQPLLTQDTSNRFGMVAASLVKFRGTNIG